MLAQEIKVNTTSIEDIDNKLVIKYDIINSTEDQNFDITLQILTSARGVITTNSLSGDIGKNVKGGKNKQIIWDYTSDNIVLQDNINIIVAADLMKNSVGIGKALILSAVCPGLGISTLDKGKPYWLLGVVGYASLGASYLFNKKANDNYNLYIKNTDESLNDGLLADSQSQNKLSKTMAYTAIGIWSVSFIWTAIRAKNKNQSTISMLNQQKIFFYTGVDPYTKTAGFSLKYRF